ncbi:MAG: DUF3631 domain-containing protein, partial [Pseudonocardiales bacterium]|nr:DUF3631 domain-containing protein [Pseudonocardiales bacterium]
ALCALDDSPWADLHGKPLDSRRLSKELARYGIKPKNLRLPTGGVTKGYRTDGEDGLADVWIWRQQLRSWGPHSGSLDA